MNVLDAAHRIGIECGMRNVSEKTGIDYDQLRAKLNPNDNPNGKRNHLYLLESVLIQSRMQRFDILYAMSEELRHVSIPLPDMQSRSCPQAVTKACAEFGDFMRKVDEVFDDGEVTPNEAKQLEKELTEMIAAAVRLQSVIVGKVDERRKVARAG